MSTYYGAGSRSITMPTVVCEGGQRPHCMCDECSVSCAGGGHTRGCLGAVCRAPQACPFSPHLLTMRATTKRIRCLLQPTRPLCRACCLSCALHYWAGVRAPSSSVTVWDVLLQCVSLRGVACTGAHSACTPRAAVATLRVSRVRGLEDLG